MNPIIQRATYGDRQATNDVTQKVQHFFESGEGFKVDNLTFGPDPIRGVRKRLMIVFAINEFAYVWNEGETVAPPKVDVRTIQSASWGRGNQTRAVLQNLQNNLLCGKRTVSYKNFLPDPAVGLEKALFVSFIGGEQYIFIEKDHISFSKT